MSKVGRTEATALPAVGVGWIRLFDYFFVLRPTLMFPLFTMFLAGRRLSRVVTPTDPENWMLLISGLVALFGLGYLINQLTDRESDRHNVKLFYVADGLLNRRALMVEAALLLVWSFAALLMANLGWMVTWVAVMLLVGGVLYSLKPFSLQSHPLGGMLAGVAGCWILLYLGGEMAGTPASIANMLPYLVAFGASGILTGLPDRQGDEAVGKRTFAVAYGDKRTMLIAASGFTVAAVIGIVGLDAVIAVPAALSLPALIFAGRRDSIKLAVGANKLAILTLSIMVGLKFPVYLAAIIVYYLLARVYYKLRFGIDYPALWGA